MCCTFGRGDTVEYRQKTQEFVKKTLNQNKIKLEYWSKNVKI